MTSSKPYAPVLLPGEGLGLTLPECTPGLTVTWMHRPRGGYGFLETVPATVVRAGKAKVTIRIETRGIVGSVQKSVMPRTLSRRDA